MAQKSLKDLTEEEVEDYKEAFNNFDKDGNGNIDQQELGVVLRSLGYSPTNKQLDEMMERVSNCSFPLWGKGGMSSKVWACDQSGFCSPFTLLSARSRYVTTPTFGRPFVGGSHSTGAPMILCPMCRSEWEDDHGVCACDGVDRVELSLGSHCRIRG